MSERQSPEKLYQDLYKELLESRAEVQRLSSLLQQAPPTVDSQERRVEESQAMALAAETARQLAEEKNLELSRMVTESTQFIARLQSQLDSLQEELTQARQDLAVASERAEARDSKEPENEASRAAVQKLHQQLSQLHATSKSKLEKMADDSRQRHQMWEQSQQRVGELQLELVQARSSKLSQDSGELSETLRSLAQQTERVAQLEDQLLQQDRHMHQLRCELEDYQLALETSEEQIHTIDGELEDREQIIDSLQAQLASYLDKLRLAQGKLYAVGEAVEQRNKWLRQLQEQNRSLNAKSRNWETLYQQSQQQKIALESERKKAVHDLEDLRWELEETQATLEDSQSMVSNLQDQLALQMPQAHRQLQQLQTKYAQACQNLAELSERFQELAISAQDSQEPTLTDLPAVVENHPELDTH